MRIAIKRAYQEAGRQDGYRVLVDRVWPRGRTRAALALDAWAKELAPSTALRRWFGHDPGRWRTFQQRYRKELASPAQRARLGSLLGAAGKGPLTLVYGAKDEEHNQAVVLRDVLARIAGGPDHTTGEPHNPYADRRVGADRHERRTRLHPGFRKS